MARNEGLWYFVEKTVKSIFPELMKPGFQCVVLNPGYTGEELPSPELMLVAILFIGAVLAPYSVEHDSKGILSCQGLEAQVTKDKFDFMSPEVIIPCLGT